MCLQHQSARNRRGQISVSLPRSFRGSPKAIADYTAAVARVHNGMPFGPCTELLRISPLEMEDSIRRR